jgi:multisubunit Na+/H+ antiporter MnhB subunit
MSKADNLITITSAVSIGLSSFVVGQALAGEANPDVAVAATASSCITAGAIVGRELGKRSNPTRDDDEYRDEDL